MTRLVTVAPLVFVVCAAGLVSPASAQLTDRQQPVTQLAAVAHGALHGVVTDDAGQPLPGVVVSALGATAAFAVSDAGGRFSFRALPPGPYLVRAHLQGYVPARSRIVQVNSAGRAVSSLKLTRRGAPDAPAQILAAGVGAGSEEIVDDAAPAEPEHDHREIAWRLRHLKRSVLKSADYAGIAQADDESIFVDSLSTIGRAVGHSARAAGSMLAELSLSGEINFLTSTSFERPQDLFTFDAAPREMAFISLNAPTGSGDWVIRGAATQGDLASWIVAGSYVRRSPAAHRYEAGMSYGMQRYRGGNAAALAAVADGSRNAGTVYAYDNWTFHPGVTVTYGAQYGRYDYLEAGGLFSPRVSVTVSPVPGLRVRGGVSRRALAPGAEEFMPRVDYGVWLPPERTFSPLSGSGGFRPEGVAHLEVSAEQDLPGDLILGIRTFRQRVADQVVTMFGVALPDSASAELGHYYIASAGDLASRGWGVSVSRPLAGRLRGSVDYTVTDARWLHMSPDVAVLSLVARSTVREVERLHDVTTSVQTDVPVTSTRVFVLYKLNTGFAAPEPKARASQVGARFDVQVNQGLPFLNFTNAQWEMLVSVRNLFRDEVLDASVYDELLVVRPPKRILGGLTVRF